MHTKTYVESFHLTGFLLLTLILQQKHRHESAADASVCGAVLVLEGGLGVSSPLIHFISSIDVCFKRVRVYVLVPMRLSAHV